MPRLATIAVSALPLLAACAGDETAAAYGGAGRAWHLVEPEGAATLDFGDRGRIAGTLPCGPWSARLRVPYPWFEAEALAAAPACAGDGLLAMLAAMRQVEIAGDVLILRDEAGREMVFEAR